MTAPRRRRSSRRRSADECLPSASPTWRLVQIADLLQRADQNRSSIQRLLGPDTNASAPSTLSASISGADIDDIKAAISDGRELAEQLDHLADGLTHAGVEISYEDLCKGAAEALSLGTLDGNRALLAARILAVNPGWHALASCIRVVDVSGSWNGLAPRELLGQFRGADDELVATVLASAGIPPEAWFSTLERRSLSRLAAALTEAARGWTGPA